MNCGQCTQMLKLNGELGLASHVVGFQTARGIPVRVHFCSLVCVFWGGVKYAKSNNPGAPTTLGTFRRLYPGAVE